MPRNREEVRRRLQLAALELFQECGYETTTAAEIAAKAGVTERTFFRHFPDKREVLFDGEAVLSEALTSAIQDVPSGPGPWETLFRAFQSIAPLFAENRPFSEPRRLIIASSPALQERELSKVRSLIAVLTSALRERGVPEISANLAAQMGMVTLGHAITTWLDDPSGDLGDHLVRAFHEVRVLSAAKA